MVRAGAAIGLCGPPTICAPKAHSLRQKTIGFLAYLAAEKRRCSRDSLSALFWPESGQSAARTNLRTVIHDAATALPEGSLLCDSDTISLNPEIVSVDLWEIDRTTKALSREQDSPEKLGAILALYRGRFLEGFTLPDCPDFDFWQFNTGQGVKEAYQTLLLRMISCSQEGASPEAALIPAMQLIASEPCEERFYRSAMQAYARCGRWGSALERLEECRAMLLKEFASAPDQETQRMGAALVRRDSAFFAPAPRRVGKPGPTPLPLVRNEFIGREKELSQLEELYRSGTPLITIAGPSGIGKTRLLLEFVKSRKMASAQDCAFIDLTRIQDSGELPRLIAAGIRLPESCGTDEELLSLLEEQLRCRPLTLCLDNFEHVMDGSRLISELLARTDSLRCIVTSREALRLQGEAVLRLASLDCGPGGAAAPQTSPNAAVRLFIARAEVLAPGFLGRREVLPAVEEICATLEGIPLAIEMAAHLLKDNEPAGIAAELSRSTLSLSNGTREAPDRHRSLELAIAWSFDRLGARERELLFDLSIFSADFERNAAEAVSRFRNDPSFPELFRSLLDKSLVQIKDGTATKLFYLFQCVREFLCKREEPGATGAGERFDAYYAGLAARSEGELFGPKQLEWIERLDAAHPNLLHAFSDLKARGDHGTGLRMATELEWFWYRKGYFRGAGDILDQFLATPDGEASSIRARGLDVRGWFKFVTGKRREAEDDYNAALAMARLVGDRETEIAALSNLGVAQRWRGLQEEGTANVETAVALARDPLVPSRLLQRALIWAYATADGKFFGKDPRGDLEEAILLSRESGDQWITAHGFNGLGDFYCASENWEAAREAYLVALDLFTQLGDRFLSAWTLNGLSLVERSSGSFGKALAYLKDAARLFDEVGDELELAALLARAASWIAEEDPEHGEYAAALAGAAEGIFDRLGKTDPSMAEQRAALRGLLSKIKKAHPVDWDRYYGQSRAEAVKKLKILVEDFNQR